MSTLETFIREHRNDLDVYTPSASVWSGIESGINHPTFVKSTVSWLKYAGFSASVIAALVYLKVNTSDATPALPAESPKAEVVQTIAQELPAPKAEAAPPAPTTKKAISLPVEISTSPALKEEKEITVTALAATAPPTPAPAAITPAPLQDEAAAGNWETATDTLRIDTIFTGVKALEIECSSFDVNIHGGTGDKISFKAHSKSQTRGIVIGKQNRKIRYERKDDVLKIIEEKEGKCTVVAGCQNIESASLDFNVPAATDVVVRCSYGDVMVNGLQDKTCNITARSGDVKLDNLTTDLTLVMGYGDLAASNITGKVGGKVSSGDVSFTNLKGNADIQTSYGDQFYKEVTGNIKAQCSSGDFKITGMKGDLDISSKYGDISLEDFKGNTVLNTSSGNIKGKNVELLERMEANTQYGDIKMKFVNALNTLSFDLETSYGSISIEKDGQKLEEDNRLVLKNGNIRVKAHTSSGDQSYK